MNDNKEPLKVIVFGDSHARYFFNSPMTLNRLKINPSMYQISGEAISAASLVGFRKKESTLNSKAKVEEAIRSNNKIVLAFGQVDLELGFYFRKVIKGENISGTDYVLWLSKIYRDFLHSINSRDITVAIKGVNLTVFSTRKFFLNYVSRIIGGSSASEDSKKQLGSALLTEKAQNKMHLDFNEKIRQISNELSFRYFDVNKHLVDSDIYFFKGERILSDNFRPGTFDHHIVDSLSVRRAHIVEMTRAFQDTLLF